MTAETLADWTTPRPFALPDLGPGLQGERREALVLFGSRATGSARPDSGGRRRWPAGGATSRRSNR